MGKVTGNWVTGAHSGRACKHEDIYTRANKKTGACYTAKLCNPVTVWNGNQLKHRNLFGAIQSSLAEWIKQNKENPSEDYLKVAAIYKRQSTYASLRGMMLARGMYRIGSDNQIVVDINAKTVFKEINTSTDPNTQQPTPNTQNPSGSVKRTLTLSADPGIGGTVQGAGEYNDGATANISATPASGYKFVRWSDGNTSASRTVTMSEDRVLTAQFQADDSEGGENSGW